MYKEAAMALPSHEELSRLALEDPQAFEALRSAMIENFIARAPQKAQCRLRQLQFRVDGIRRRSRSPLGALLKIQGLMWDSYLELNEELQMIVGQRRGAAQLARAKPKPREARVIEFHARSPRQTP